MTSPFPKAPDCDHDCPCVVVDYTQVESILVVRVQCSRCGRYYAVSGEFRDASEISGNLCPDYTAALRAEAVRKGKHKLGPGFYWVNYDDEEGLFAVQDTEDEDERYWILCGREWEPHEDLNFAAIEAVRSPSFARSLNQGAEIDDG